MRFDTADVAKLAQAIGPRDFLMMLLIFGFLGGGYMLIDRVIEREDAIYDEEVKIRERLIAIDAAIAAESVARTTADQATEARFRDWLATQAEQLTAIRNGFGTLAAWQRASCYASAVAANGDADAARLHCDGVGARIADTLPEGGD